MGVPHILGFEPRRFCECERDTLYPLGGILYLRDEDQKLILDENGQKIAQHMHKPLCILCEDDKARGLPYGIEAREPPEAA